MLKRSDYTDPDRPPSLGKPQTKFDTPNVFDLVVIEDIPISPEKYKPIPYGSPHQDYANNGLVLVYQGPVKAANNQVQVRRVYASQADAPENWFNYGVRYSGDATTNPIYLRSYTILRDNYVPLAKGSLLTSIAGLKVTAGGSGYDRENPPAVSFSGGGGSGAMAKAILSPNGVLIGLQVLAEGTGYTSAPTVTIAAPPLGGTQATATAFVQPTNSYLVKEELAQQDSKELHSLFVRVNRIYEVLPGPWLPYSRWDDELGAVQGLKRAVLTLDPPQTAISSASGKTVYEAREGSSIVSMEIVEVWGTDPYAHKFEVEINDPTPDKFKADVPTTTISQVEPGRAELPVLATGELRRTSDEVNKFWRREAVTRRDPPSYPRELADYELGGIHTHGSEFGGTLETKHRLHNQPQTVEEGFDIIASKVEALGHGLTWRRTTRLFSGGFGLGPYIELLTGGDSYVDDPAVIFSAGDQGSGAAGTASITETPIAITDIDPGGVFTQTFVSNGDANGVFNFLGKRYNAGVWRNPADAGNVTLSAQTHPSYPVTQAQLNALTDRSLGAPFGVGIVPKPGGGHFIMIDLGPGRTLKCNKITFQNPVSVGGSIMHNARVFGFNKFGVTPDTIATSIPLPSAASAWTGGAVDDSVGYRYFWIYGLDARISSTPEIWPVLLLGEIELYGELTIAPEVELGYAYNGDANGAFYYLGARGGSGTWRNPHTAGDIEITLPFDALEYGTLDSMVDREPSNTYLVNRDHSEIWFDLGVDRSLLLTTLTFRQRADYGSSMTQTSIQGSVDGVTWEEFQHFNPSPTASAWTKVDITAFTKYYRFFRLIIPIGKSFHSIGELELYGSLRLNAAGSAEAPGYSVTGVTITAPGTNYATAPRVSFSGGGPGTGAAATAVIEDGKVVRVDMTATGSGYTSPPDVAFAVGDGGSGATASATVAGGAVTALTLLTGGTGYTEAPKVKIVSSTGSGATAHAVLTGDVVSSIVLDTPGSGYVLPPTVVLYPFSDPEADAEIGFDIDAITLVSGGSGYSSPPAVSIEGDGDTPARAVAVLGFPLTSVAVDNPGGGYTSTPTAVFAGDGTGAAGTAVRAFDIASTTVTAAGSGYVTEPVVQVTGDGSDAQFQALIARALLRIDIAASGSGYTSDPTVVITGDGTGAAAHVVRSFAVASIAVSAGGAGYTVAPTVTIPAPTGVNGRTATAHAVLTAGAVTSIVIDDPGAGYLTAPVPTMTGGDGAGATIGAATLASGGAINNIVIDTAGSGFSEPPIISFTGGAGSGAAASAILDTTTAGGIAKIRIINAGKDYTVAPTLAILPGTSGGTGATATATLSTTGKIKSVTLTNPGSGYTSDPTVSFTGGGGSGASGKGVRAATGSVKSVTLLDPGDGFRSGATVSFLGGGGSGASATIAPTGCGKVTKVTLTKAGGPFTEPPDVIFVGGQSNSCPSLIKAFRPTGALSAAFFNNNGGAHQTALLDNGKVLATGGTGGSGTRAEIYDPATELWTTVASMPTARSGHCAVKLANGKVIVFGGSVSTFVPNLNCYIYDPVANTWTATGSMVATGADDPAAAAGSSGFPSGPAFELAGTYTHAVVLDDGKIFCARGFREDNAIQIYDPVAGTWSVKARFELEWGANYGYITQRFTKLPDGNILAAFGGWPTTLVGGIREARYAIYDTGADSWTYALVNGGGVKYQNLHSQILLNDGRVLVAAGLPDSGAANTLLYDYLTDTWAVSAADYPTQWYGRIPVKWADGRIALVGGQESIGPGRGYTIFDPVTNAFAFHGESLMASEHDHTVAELLLTGNIIVVGGSSLATCELLASVPTPATAAYRLGSSWPTLREEQTDPTEGIIILIDKTIVPPTTPLPAGFSEKFPLDIYRSIQIVSKVNLRSLPPPDVWDTTQNVSFPHLLLAIYPIWDTNKANATAGGLATGTQRGSVSASVQVIGSIVVTKLDGFRGAALATVERQFFFGPPPRELVPEPTIIRPSSGTAIVKTTRNSSSRSGLTYSATGASNPAGNDFASYAKSSASSGASTQVVDLHDVLSVGLSSHSEFNATNQSFADALNVAVGAKGTFDVVLPASTPFAMEPGRTILAQVGVEKWRFGLYVRTLIRVTIPALP